MSQSHLLACPSCARHVRVSESACPFCRAGLTEAFRATPARQAPRARLSRAALFAIGTGAAALAPGCSSTSDGQTTQPLYGGVALEDSGSDAASTGSDAGPATGSDAATGASDAASEEDGPSAQPLYGAVAHDDAGNDAGMTAQPLYGAAALYGGFPGH